MVLALRNKLCRTGANIPLFRTWADMTLAFSSKTHNNFCLCMVLGHRWSDGIVTTIRDWGVWSDCL